jgi:hypothetical protein
VKNDALKSAPLSHGNGPKSPNLVGNSTVGVKHLTAAASAKNAEIPAASRHVLDSKPFITARRAAEIIGVTEAEVIADIDAGGAFSINGARTPSGYIVQADDLIADRPTMHRKRLTASGAEGL